ncbi:MAG: hypothetical protein M3373_14605 [Gemmatimonadota bacterium]|nr:hypothetical protein [Gemmatimonadota bacterium]
MPTKGVIAHRRVRQAAGGADLAIPQRRNPSATPDPAGVPTSLTLAN